MKPQQTLTVRAAADRGKADFGWLKSAHTFSFGNYHDPDHMQFGVLRVINDDAVSGGGGFPPHPHRDAEIFSYVLEGALQHKVSMGNGSTVAEGGVQYMSAGRGVTHSEFNPSKTAPVRFLQVWFIPETSGGDPRYETLFISESEKQGKMKLFLSSDGREGSIQTRAKANVYVAKLNSDDVVEHDLGSVPKAWLQIARGTVHLNNEPLVTGDGVAIEGGGSLVLSEGVDAEVLLFEMP